MAKNMQPIAKRCKKLGIEPSVMGYNKKTTNRNSNGNMRRKKSEYCLQLNEKQKVKFIYGIMEKQSVVTTTRLLRRKVRLVQSY